MPAASPARNWLPQQRKYSRSSGRSGGPNESLRAEAANPGFNRTQRLKMSATWVRLSALAITIVSSLACAAETSAPGQLVEATASTLPILQLSKLIENGRPSGFYKLVVDDHPAVCAALTEALNKPHSVLTGRGKDPARDLLLGNEHSIEWDELKSDRGLPVSRTDIDINNDGGTETIYREASVLGGPYLYSLFLTKDHPAEETKVSRKRQMEIAGDPVPDPRWGGIPENELYFTGTKYVTNSSEQIETIRPPLPTGVTLPFGLINDIVRIGNRHYVLIGPAYYAKEVPIRLFVFETRAPRDHSLLCYFESNFSLQRP